MAVGLEARRTAALESGATRKLLPQVWEMPAAASIGRDCCK